MVIINNSNNTYLLYYSQAKNSFIIYRINSLVKNVSNTFRHLQLRRSMTTQLPKFIQTENPNNEYQEPWLYKLIIENHYGKFCNKTIIPEKLKYLFLIYNYADLKSFRIRFSFIFLWKYLHSWSTKTSTLKSC